MHHVSSNPCEFKSFYSHCVERSPCILFLPSSIVPLESYHVYATHPATLSMDTRALHGFISSTRKMKRTTSSCSEPRNGGLLCIIPGPVSELSERLCNMSMSMSVEQQEIAFFAASTISIRFPMLPISLAFRENSSSVAPTA